MTLKSLYNLFASHKESSWIMQPTNVYLLYDFVKTHKIKKVLDLGCGFGASVATVALALKDKGEKDYEIHTVEQYDKCLKLAKEIIPQELQEKIKFHKSEVVTRQFKNIPHQTFSEYKKVPEGNWDLIINDGPSPCMEGEHYIDLANSTITSMLLEDKIKPGCYIAWDGRQVMLKLLERYYGDNFWLARPAQRGDDLNILERKNNEVCFKDEKLELMKQSTYFNEKDNNTTNSKTTSC
jgi:hypothetical protein